MDNFFYYSGLILILYFLIIELFGARCRYNFSKRQTVILGGSAFLALVLGIYNLTLWAAYVS